MNPLKIRSAPAIASLIASTLPPLSHSPSLRNTYAPLLHGAPINRMFPKHDKSWKWDGSDSTLCHLVDTGCTEGQLSNSYHFTSEKVPSV